MRTFLFAALCVVSAPAAAQEVRTPDDWSRMTLSYEAPADQWDHALPVGNGRLGAMVYGGTAMERIALNEETLWTGGPYDPTREGGAAALPEIRRLLFSGDVERAHDLFGRTMMGIPYEQQKYQPLASLHIDSEGHEDATDYRRELDLDAGVVRVRYLVGEVAYSREVFASAPDQIVVVHLTADRPGAISFDARLFGKRNTAHSNYDTAYFQMDGVAPETLRLTGKNADYLGIEGKLTYEARLVAQAEGGSVDMDYRTLRVRNADAVTLVIAAATSFVDFQDTSGDPAGRVAQVLSKVSERSFAELRERHVADHRSLFRRVGLWMGDPGLDALSTPERLARVDSLPDPGLAAQLYQFGRYTLIGSSRPGTQAANLQGIWNDNPNPWWDSKYTVNVNLPMNYWAAESAGLPELAEPLFALIRDVSVAGQSVAEAHWGARGWVLHQNTDLWRATAPMDGPSWGAWPVGGAWLTTHLWEHERFEPSRDFLEEWYPILRGQARFLADVLVEHPEHGWLVTAPSNSPENFPAYPGNGRYFDEVSGLFLKGRMMQPGPTMDNQIVGTVFDAFLDWSERLGQDADMQGEIAAKRKRLPPMQIGRRGQLQEWLEDWDELEPDHRHLSHLWGVYPGEEITPEETSLAEAAATSVRLRSTGGCGWSYAHKVGVWARLLQPAGVDHEVTKYLAGNVLPNLFSRCGRAMQVDGTLGMVGSMGEALVQSHQGLIDLLPASPWPTGRVTGIRARGGFEVDLDWSEGGVESAAIRSAGGGPVRIRGMRPVRIERDGQAVSFRQLGDIVEFETVTGGAYLLHAR